MIKFYNSLTRKKEVFKPIEKNRVKIYSCGPTVYNYVHIGNLRAYVFNDILARALKYFDYEVLNVMNLTDVDDKTIKGAKKEFSEKSTEPNEILKKFTQKYTQYFYEDLESMNIKKPKIIISATASIKEMEFLIEKLYEKGYAYISEDGIYFDISKNKKYGKLVNIDFSAQKYNKENRVVADEYEKDNAQDFVLWKFKKKETEPSWIINIGKKKYEGRPGWHIECSAMSMKYLGDIFDIHSGGIDLKFPHHENEIAQSSCALGVEQQANFWMHNGHLLVDEKKMSKSFGSFYTLRDIKERGFNPIALREVYLRSHYRQQLNFTFESIKAGETNVKKINDFYLKLKEIKPNLNIKDKVKNIYNEKLDMFETALKDDLNTPIAISALYEFIHEINKKTYLSENDIKLAIKFMRRTDTVLGLLEKIEEVPLGILELAKKRKIARQEKKWDTADRLRDEIKEKGWEIKDSSSSKESFILNKV